MDGECLAEYDIAVDGGLNFRRRFGAIKSPDGICLDREGAVWAAAADAFLPQCRDLARTTAARQIIGPHRGDRRGDCRGGLPLSGRRTSGDSQNRRDRISLNK
jgi:sugar lactone lactonase YvrE